MYEEAVLKQVLCFRIASSLFKRIQLVRVLGWNIPAVIRQRHTDTIHPNIFEPGPF